MREVLTQPIYDFISAKDKQFIIAFDDAMQEIGYDSGRSIGTGYCWGRYMLVYTKSGVKDKRVAARIYIRNSGAIVLRLFFSNVDKHREYIDSAPEFIKQPFIDDHGVCHHCPTKKDDHCAFRKTYTIGDRLIEKCSGVTFEFHQPDTDKLPAYMVLIKEFYPGSGRRKARVDC